MYLTSSSYTDKLSLGARELTCFPRVCQNVTEWLCLCCTDWCYLAQCSVQVYTQPVRQVGRARGGTLPRSQARGKYSIQEKSSPRALFSHLCISFIVGRWENFSNSFIQIIQWILWRNTSLHINVKAKDSRSSILECKWMMLNLGMPEIADKSQQTKEKQ